jgi:hypothetical protein
MRATTHVHPTPWQLFSRPLVGLRLRPATPGVVVELAALKRRVETATYGHLGAPEALAARLQQRCTAWYLLTRLGEGDLVLVAEMRDRLIGMAAAAIQPGPVLRLHSAYVEHAGYGAGRALTATRLEAAARLGVTELVADCLVGAPEAAARLARLGMIELGRTESPTFPGVDVSHWSGKVRTALERATS